MSILQRLWLWAPVVLFMAYVLSLQGDEDLPFVDSLWDKGVHFGAFCLFGFLCLRATHGGLRRLPAARPTWIAAAIAISFGVIDEWRQVYLPGRYASVYDSVADALGVLLSVVLWLRVLPIRVNRGRKR
ncbi:MAG: VanZ family protein [Acidobacteriota bacterium]|nr:VanZ family protein [Acidobacteriota bacterium]MDH3785958.1 VanZ family protein [Acidobacteriota bacterium]